MEVIYENKVFKVLHDDVNYKVINKKTNIVEMETNVITQALFQADTVQTVLEKNYPGFVEGE